MVKKLDQDRISLFRITDLVIYDFKIIFSVKRYWVKADKSYYMKIKENRNTRKFLCIYNRTM